MKAAVGFILAVMFFTLAAIDPHPPMLHIILGR